MRLPRPLLVLLLAALALGPLGGCSGEPTDADVGGRADARARLDAASLEDVGSDPGLDAGAPADTGEFADSGPEGGDVGTAPQDAASQGADAASVGEDVGGAGEDSGLAPDVGTADTGSQGPDAGSVGPRPCSDVSAAAPDPANYDAVLGCLRNPSESAGTKQQAVGVFVAAVEAHGGFPILAGDEAIFVYVREAAWDAEDDAQNSEEDFSAARRAEPLRVAGEFNTWQPSLTLAAEGSSFFHLKTTLAGAAGQRWAYKFVAKDAGGADVWFSDPLSRRFDYDANGRYSIVRGSAARGHLEWLRKAHDTRLNNDRLIYLYVPRGYDTASLTYPVLYLHDGNNAFSTNQPWSAPVSWEADAVAEAEITAGRAKEFLIVGVPNNGDRMDEYTHVPDDIGGGQIVGGKGDDYADFLVNDLKPLVDGRYRTLPGKESTGILGSSLGGLISYYVAYKHPGVFKYVGGMSSTFDWGLWGTVKQKTVVQLYAETADLKARGQVYYLDSGGKIPTGGCKFDGNDSDADNYCGTLNMKNTLVAAGVDTFPLDPTAATLQPADVNILHFFEPGAQHNEAAWNLRLPMALRLFERP